MAKKITFSLAAEIVADASEGLLLGDFNGWLHEAGIKLKKQKDGSLKASVELEPGVYQYRYFLNDGRWVNDGNAGGYAFNGQFGVENCVISVPHEEVKETLAKEELAPVVEAKPKKVATKKEAAPVAKIAEKPAAAAKKPAAAAKPAATAKAAAAPAKKPAAAPAKKAAAKKTK